MNFLTFSFLVFFFLCVLCYYLCPGRAQNAALLIANCVFYLWSGPTLGIFLIIAALGVYLCALAIERGRHRRLWTALGVIYLLGSLFVFKYLDFLGQLFLDLAGRDGAFSLGLVLPVGISFYSFSLAGYLFDVYRGKLKAERNLLHFAVFASFFPSILSGPINRARELLPQLRTRRPFDLERFKSGLWRFLCGAAKKLIVSSMLTELINPAYADPTAFGSGAWLIVVISYSIYIYVDFSAYSDMAVGTAQMLNLTLMENFRAPYISRTVKEFWKKWHISLTSWFREYLYFPLGGSRLGQVRTWLNVLIVFAVSGLWHGAGLTFLVWGLLNGLYQVFGELTLPARRKLYTKLRLRETAWYITVFQTLFTFGLITVAWVFFRADSLEEAVFILKRILLLFRDGFGPLPALLPWRKLRVLLLALCACLAEDLCITHSRRFPIERTSFPFWICTALLAAAFFLFGQYGPGFHAQDFVYFKF